MSAQRCSCNACTCSVDANAALQDGKAYCCEACANGHSSGEPCRMADCTCSERGQPKPNSADSALDETGPMGDPVSP